MEGAGRGDARSGGAWGGALDTQWWGRTRGMRAVAERGAGRWTRSGGVLDAGDARAKGEHFSIFCPSLLLI